MSTAQTNDEAATVTALSNRLHDLEATTTSRINALEAIIQAQQVQIDLDQLIAANKFQHARTSRDTKPGHASRDAKMPRFRQKCRRDKKCRYVWFGFTHSAQRARFGDAIEGLPDYVEVGEMKVEK